MKKLSVITINIFPDIIYLPFKEMEESSNSNLNIIFALSEIERP